MKTLKRRTKKRRKMKTLRRRKMTMRRTVTTRPWATAVSIHEEHGGSVSFEKDPCVVIQFRW